MATIETVSVGQGGSVPLPSSIREAAGIDPGSVVTPEAQDGSIVIRPVGGDTENYALVRQAEFLLSNAVDAGDYAAACDEVRRMGLDPAQIPHHRLPGV